MKKKKYIYIYIYTYVPAKPLQTNDLAFPGRAAVAAKYECVSNFIPLPRIVVLNNRANWPILKKAAAARLTKRA
jgi:hypothetical protein